MSDDTKLAHEIERLEGNHSGFAGLGNQWRDTIIDAIAFLKSCQWNDACSEDKAFNLAIRLERLAPVPAPQEPSAWTAEQVEAQIQKELEPDAGAGLYPTTVAMLKAYASLLRASAGSAQEK